MRIADPLGDLALAFAVFFGLAAGCFRGGLSLGRLAGLALGPRLDDGFPIGEEGIAVGGGSGFASCDYWDRSGTGAV
jgi:hypothetical protein